MSLKYTQGPDVIYCIEIARRVMEQTDKFSFLDIARAISIANANAGPFDLLELLREPDDIFIKEIENIMEKLDLSTGSLQGFVPRCLKKT